MRDRDPKLIVNLTRGSVVAERAEVLEGPLAGVRALLGRGALPRGEAVLLRSAPAIHTALIRFSIDAAFLDSGLRILRLVHSISPWRVAALRGASAVLALPAGAARRRELRLGDRLAVLEHAIRPSDRTRVLVVARDRRFRAAASALLAGRGCAVSLHDEVEEVADRAARERPQVVVIDATASLTAAARTAARLETMRPPVGVVTVSDEPHDHLATLPLLPKWGSFEALFVAVQEASRRGHDA